MSPGKDTLLVDSPLLTWRDGGRGSRSGIMGAELERFIASRGHFLTLDSTSRRRSGHSWDTVKILCRQWKQYWRLMAQSADTTTGRGTHTRAKQMSLRCAVPEEECIRQPYSFSVAITFFEQINRRTHLARTRWEFASIAPYQVGGRCPAFGC